MGNTLGSSGSAAGSQVAEAGPRPQRHGKPPQVDELIDYYLNRRVAAVVVKVLLHTTLTPNQVSFISMLFSVAAGACLFFRAVNLAAVASGILYMGIVLDCADGQLARARGGGSLTGRIVDGICDYLSGIALFVGACWFAAPIAPAWLPLPIWALGIIAGLSTVLHCALQDHKKLVFLRTFVPDFDEGAGTPEAVGEELNRAREKRLRLDIVFLQLYLLYGRVQSVFSALAQRPVTASESPQHVENTSRLQLLGARCWSFLGFTTHLFLLVIACFLCLAAPQAVLWYLLTVAVLGNVWMIALLALGA